MAILTIAKLTLREASRRKLLIAVVALTLLAGVLSGWAFHRLLDLPCGSTGSFHRCSAATQRLLAATLLTLLMFMFSFVLAVGAAFLAAPAIVNEIESGVTLAILPRPIRRSDVVLGKWLGLAIILSAYAGASCGLEFIICKISMNYLPPHPILSILFVIAEAVIVLTVTLLFSTRIPAMTGGIIILVLFGLTWMGGVAGSIGGYVHSRPIEMIGTVSSLIFPTDGLWRAAIYYLEPVALVMAQQAEGQVGQNPFMVTTPPATAYLLWVAGWTTVMLSLAVWSFSRREL